MKVVRRIIVGLVLLLIGLAGLGFSSAGGRILKSLGLKSSIDGDAIKVSGNIEVIDVAVSFKIPGRVAERPVDEGDTIESGSLVARLETKDLESEAASRQADLALAKATLAELENGSRPQEKISAEAAVRAAQADEVRLKAERDRAAALVKQVAVSQEAYDRALAAYEVAVEKLKQAREQQSMVMEGAREEVKQQARARVRQIQAALDLAETRLKYATLRWPPEGVVLPETKNRPLYVVLSKNVEPGEYVAPGTSIVTIGEMVNVWLRAYINETDLGRVKLGQKVHVKTDTYPDKTYEGRVSFISQEAEFTPKNVQTEKERVKLVYRIKIDIANDNMELKPGMPADAEIIIGQ
jgi:HlyD family secretion protein